MDPIRDYDAFINGHWKETHHIPKDKSRWSMFTMVSSKIDHELESICKHDRGLIGQVYQKALHPPTYISPLVLNMIESVSKITTLDDFIKLSWKYYLMDVKSFFRIDVDMDSKNNTIQVPHVYQAGLGLNDKSYYNNENTCQAYKHYIDSLCQLYGFHVSSSEIIALEKQIATLSMDAVNKRNVDKIYHRVEHKDLPTFFTLLGLDLPYIIVDNMEWFQALPALLKNTPLETWKYYLIYKIADSYAMFQTKAIRYTKFAFYQQTLLGTKKQSSSSYLAVQLVKRYLPTLLQQMYIDYYFDHSMRQKALEMTQRIIRVLKWSIMASTWMSEETKQLSLQKILNMKIDIGYPSKWEEEYNTFPMDTDLSTWNRNWSMWKYQRLVFGKFYQPSDRNVWGTYHTYDVNAYYESERNRVVLPAGLLQKPFLGYTNDSQNYGALGTLIGHELTHGFDDQGSKFNPKGELLPWWTPSDLKTYEDRSDHVRKFYFKKIVGGEHINGRLTLGENMADIGGLTLSLRAAPNVTLFLFFTTYAIIWRDLMEKKTAQQYAHINPHSPNKFRINAVVTHIPEFYQAYGHKLTLSQINKLRKFSIW